MMIFDVNILLETEGTAFNSFTVVDQASKAVFRLKALLKTAGWVHQASGDGLAAFTTTSGNVNDVITQDLSGANGLANPLAWFILQHPASTRQFVFQKGNDNGDPGATGFSGWRIKYSRIAGFTGGTPSSIETPLAADEFAVLGGGTDVAPTFEPWFGYPSNGIGGAYCHIGADNAAPYGWYIMIYPIVGDAFNAPRGGGVFDPVVDTQPGDADPYVFYFTRQNGEAWRDSLSDYDPLYGLFDAGGPNEQWLGLKAVGYPEINSAGLSFLFSDNKVNRLPLFYFSSVQSRIYKGRSTMIHWIGSSFINGQSLKVSTAREEVVVGWASLKWNGTAPKV